jgi:hypothetical protein
LPQPRPGGASELELELDETGGAVATHVVWTGRIEAALAVLSMIGDGWSSRQVFITSRTTVTATLDRLRRDANARG